MPPPPPRSGTDVCLRTNARGSDRGVRQELAASLKENCDRVATIRAMADGTLDSQVGARICNGLVVLEDP